jgi:hypothetical protein
MLLYCSMLVCVNPSSAIWSADHKVFQCEGYLTSIIVMMHEVDLTGSMVIQFCL